MERFEKSCTKMQNSWAKSSFEIEKFSSQKNIDSPFKKEKTNEPACTCPKNNKYVPGLQKLVDKTAWHNAEEQEKGIPTSKSKLQFNYQKTVSQTKIFLLSSRGVLNRHLTAHRCLDPEDIWPSFISPSHRQYQLPCNLIHG